MQEQAQAQQMCSHHLEEGLGFALVMSLLE